METRRHGDTENSWQLVGNLKRGAGDKETRRHGERLAAGRQQKAGGSGQSGISNVEFLGLNNSRTQETQQTREQGSWQQAGGTLDSRIRLAFPDRED
jgi:hypothetical protein